MTTFDTKRITGVCVIGVNTLQYVGIGVGRVLSS
jgi:hypothetical protein